MAMGEIRHNLWRLAKRRLLGSSNGASQATLSTKGATTGGASIRPLRRSRYLNQPPIQKTKAIEYARFGLLTLGTLPFSLWVALYSYDYLYRVDLCQKAIIDSDEEISRLHEDYKKSQNSKLCYGRDKELSEIRTLLMQQPHQVIVVAGANESGKSLFVKELLRDVDAQRAVTYMQFGQLGIDSVSTLTHVLVTNFNLRWLAMRYALVDVLPFAGSEILVMKERFSDRDLTQALRVITEALKQEYTKNSKAARPILVIDGLGEGQQGSKNTQSYMQKIIQWCIYLTKERNLAHVIVTGDEKLVINLTSNNRLTRGHIKVIGLSDLDREGIREVILHEIPDATEKEIEKIIDAFGGFVHDVRGASRDLQNWLSVHRNNSKHKQSRTSVLSQIISERFRFQAERVLAAFAKGNVDNRESDSDKKVDADSEDEDEMDPYLDPLKSIYSEAHASQTDASNSDDSAESASYTKLQLWNTIQRLVKCCDEMAVPFSELRDEVYDGDIKPLLQLMEDDILGFEIDSSSKGTLSWKVKPATPAIGKAFRELVLNGSLKEEFQEVERENQHKNEIKKIEKERRRLWQERRRLQLRKAYLRSTVELGKELGRTETAKTRFVDAYDAIVAEEVANEAKDSKLRENLQSRERQSRMQPEFAQKKKVVEGDTASPRRLADHLSLQDQLKSAIEKIIIKEDPAIADLSQARNADKLKKFFRQLEKSGHGDTLTAADVARIMKKSTGKDVNLDTARALIQAWDSDGDKQLGFDEFVKMLFGNPKAAPKTCNENLPIEKR